MSLLGTNIGRIRLVDRLGKGPGADAAAFRRGSAFQIVAEVLENQGGVCA